LRYAILSDIHGNLDALKAVLAALEPQQIDSYACLGDIVGYGPQPSECLHEIQKYASIVVAGNHDYAACDRISMASFNVLAKEAILWTRSKLSDGDTEYLANLPLEDRLESFHVVHGALCAPELFDYVQTSYDAYLTMSRMEAPICFVGHSHVPVTFLQDEMISYTLGDSVQVPPSCKAIVNVGSVGQPRDKDPRACYAIYDTDQQKVTIQRTPYDIESVVSRIRDAGLPASLGERLRTGR
jgi:predicted phosphodiesterase